MKFPVVRTAPFKSLTPATDRDRTVSRRSEPSSRATLIGEQPNPWVEKQPLIYNEVRYSDQQYKNEPIDKEEANTIFTREVLGISETGTMKFYNILENRRILEAKLACWLEEYSKAFPDQIELYMEDEECAVYKFEQNPYMMNNFAIDYGCNENTDLEYYKKLRIRMLEWKEDVTQIEEKIKEIEEQENEK